MRNWEETVMTLLNIHFLYSISLKTMIDDKCSKALKRVYTQILKQMPFYCCPHYLTTPSRLGQSELNNKGTALVGLISYISYCSNTLQK